MNPGPIFNGLHTILSLPWLLQHMHIDGIVSWTSLIKRPILNFSIRQVRVHCEDPLKRIVIFPLDYDYLR